MAIDFATLSPEDKLAMLEFARSVQTAEVEAKKEARSKTRKFVGDFVRIVATRSGVPEQSFKSGAVGWSLGGKDVEIVVPDGLDESGAEKTRTRKARVSILIRWEDTIPATEKKTPAAKSDATANVKSDVGVDNGGESTTEF